MTDLTLIMVLLMASGTPLGVIPKNEARSKLLEHPDVINKSYKCYSLKVLILISQLFIRDVHILNYTFQHQIYY